MAERQTRWFQVPVLRDVWVQIPSSAPNKRGYTLAVYPFCFIMATGFEIGRKLRSNLSEGPNSPVDCLSAKAATGGNPVIRTKKYCRKGYTFLQYFFIQVADLAYHRRTKCDEYHQPFGLYLITLQRAFSCDLMICNTPCW